MVPPTEKIETLTGQNGTFDPNRFRNISANWRINRYPSQPIHDEGLALF
jgi:hypothetical protein